MSVLLFNFLLARVACPEAIQIFTLRSMFCTGLSLMFYFLLAWLGLVSCGCPCQYDEPSMRRTRLTFFDVQADNTEGVEPACVRPQRSADGVGPYLPSPGEEQCGKPIHTPRLTARACQIRLVNCFNSCVLESQASVKVRSRYANDHIHYLMLQADGEGLNPRTSAPERGQRGL